MTSIPDKIQELEQKLEALQRRHEDLLDRFVEQIPFLTRCITDLELLNRRLSSRLSEQLDAIEKVALDAYLASSEDAQNTLAEIDDLLPLDFPQLSFHRLSTIRELRQEKRAAMLEFRTENMVD